MDNFIAVQKILSKSQYIQSIEEGDEGELDGTFRLWEREDARLSIQYGYDDEPLNLSLFQENFDKLENRLDWLNANKSLIGKHFIENDGQFDGFNEWLEQQLHKKGSVVIDGETFTQKISEDTFINALYPLSVRFWLMEDEDFDCERLNCEITLACDPDFLFGHIATMEIDKDDTIGSIAIDG